MFVCLFVCCSWKRRANDCEIKNKGGEEEQREQGRAKETGKERMRKKKESCCRLVMCSMQQLTVLLPSITEDLYFFIAQQFVSNRTKTRRVLLYSEVSISSHKHCKSIMERIKKTKNNIFLSHQSNGRKNTKNIFDGKQKKKKIISNKKIDRKHNF